MWENALEMDRGDQKKWHLQTEDVACSRYFDWSEETNLARMEECGKRQELRQQAVLGQT